MNFELFDDDEWAGVVRAVKALGGAICIMITAALVVGLVGLPDEPRSEPSMVAVAPAGVVSVDDIPTGLVSHYETARIDYDTFEDIPCFCGCEEMLGHRHLGDCFVRADGSGLEAHALGCGVCIGEAAQVAGMLRAGVDDSAEIRAAVVARWGDPFSTGDR